MSELVELGRYSELESSEGAGARYFSNKSEFPLQKYFFQEWVQANKGSGIQVYNPIGDAFYVGYLPGGSVGGSAAQSCIYWKILEFKKPKNTTNLRVYFFAKQPTRFTYTTFDKDHNEIGEQSFDVNEPWVPFYLGIVGSAHYLKIYGSEFFYVVRITAHKEVEARLESEIEKSDFPILLQALHNKANARMYRYQVESDPKNYLIAEIREDVGKLVISIALDSDKEPIVGEYDLEYDRFETVSLPDDQGKNVVDYEGWIYNVIGYEGNDDTFMFAVKSPVKKPYPPLAKLGFTIGDSKEAFEQGALWYETERTPL